MQPSNAEVRAGAVARLKRAASLPRIKGGRRPPMHPEGTSEGEKSRDELSNPSSKQEEESKNVTSDERDELTQPERREEHIEPAGESNEQDGGISEGIGQEDGVGPSNGQSFSPPPTPTKRKRRSRSRSRSRSKDLKELKLSKSPPPPEESSPETRTAPLPSSNDIPVASPIPSRPSPFQGVGRFPFLPPTAPSTPAPMTPVLPTLQDLQQRFVGTGLSRSQSASRAATMLKLTGELPDEPSPSPALSRSATVSGSEQRVAARQRMFGRIQNRVGGQTDDALTSGGEDAIPVSVITAKKRRRRSRKSSNPAAVAAATAKDEPAVVDDRDPADLSTSTDTPLVPSSPLPDSHSYPASPLPDQTSQLLGQQNFFSPFAAAMANGNGNYPNLDPFPQSTNAINLQWTFQQLGLQNALLQSQPAQDTWQERDVVIEEEDSEASIPPRSPSPQSHRRLHHSASQSSVDEPEDHREPHTSDAPSSLSGQDIPVLMSSDLIGTPYEQDVFPLSPFHTPAKERQSGEEEEDEILYDGPAEGYRNHSGKAINGGSVEWPQYTEQEVPIQSEGDDDVDENAPESVDNTSPERLVATSPSPGPGEAYYIPSPSPASTQPLNIRQSDSSIESTHEVAELTNMPNTTGIFTVPRESSYTDVGTDYEDVQTDKETPDNKLSKWRSLLRTNSFTGRRSRANSTTKREEKALKRESGASAKADQSKQHEPAPSTAPSAWNSPAISTSALSPDPSRQGQSIQPPSASASILSFAPMSPHRGGPSPIPPPSPAAISKYGANDKLAPFPGLINLAEERKMQRSRRMSVSSPNLPHDVAAAAAFAAASENMSEAERRERKLSHQYSDTGLLQKFRGGTESAPSTSANPPVGKGSAGWLPSSRNEVKIWYKLNRIFNPGSQPTTPTISNPILPPSRPGSRPGSRQQKREPLLHKASKESTREVEDVVSNQSMTPKSRVKTSPHADPDAMDLPSDPFASPGASTRRHQNSLSSTDSFVRQQENDVQLAPIKTPGYSRPALSIIPEPIPSDQSWAPSHTDSSLSSDPSFKPDESPSTPVHQPQRTSVLLGRLESILTRDAKERIKILDEPPRRMLMSCSLYQVVDSDTIRERFLFIFNDILVIAKPLESNEKHMDRLFMVKNVIDVHSAHVISRDVGSPSSMRHPLVLQFVRDFNTNPDAAVELLVQGAQLIPNEEGLGKLLFETTELDRTRVGIYLSKKSRKGILKAYIDCFGFAGVRIDHALRAFVLSIRLPAEAPEHAGEHVLNIFATRWFDANAKLVSFDKDITMKLVRILVHLDTQMNRGSSGIFHNGAWRQRDFHTEWESMVRSIDPRGLLPDDLVQSIYFSLQKDPLRWAIEQHYYWEEYTIGFKRAPATTIAHRVQSDPIVIRINRPDPDLRIQLLSQDGITFDPSELNFARSTEATFRMTGSTLGPKTIILSLVGNNAPLYHGLPYSTTVVVERSFMRNTFQIAFKDHRGAKRRYMFSAEDSLLCHQCVVQICKSQQSKQGTKESEDTADTAARALSLAILRDSLSTKLSGNEIIMYCRQNSILVPILSHVIPTTPS